MTNYNTMKNEEILELLEKYELEKADYINENGSVNRKKACNILKLIGAMAGKEGDNVVVVDDETGDVSDLEPTIKIRKGLSGMMVQITFYSSDENDLPYVQMALNGLALIVPREVKVWIPKEFLDGVLQTAIMTKMKMVVTDTGKIRYQPKNLPRFQYTVHDIKHIDVLKREFDEKKKKENK